MAGNDEIVKLIAVGDIGFRNTNPGGVFDPARAILKGADITFGQLETVLSNHGPHSTFAASGSPSRPNPNIKVGPPRHQPIDPLLAVKTLLDANIKVISFASNHAFNQGEEGMLDTIELLKANNIQIIGAGKNIIEAVKPALFSVKGVKVGFLAYCSVVVPGTHATPTRAGVAPIRATTSYQQFDWQPGAPARILSKADSGDLAGMMDDIKKLRSQVDVLIVSMHWGVHFLPSLIADYQREAGHAAIDAGADLILGHHAHILKGIEVYKGKVIFYCLNNFSMHGALSNVTTAAGKHYMNMLGYRSEVDPKYTGYGYHVDSQKSTLAKIDITSKGIQRVAYLPLWMTPDGDPLPVPRSDARSDEHFRYMQWLCADQALDTSFSREGDDVVVNNK